MNQLEFLALPYFTYSLSRSFLFSLEYKLLDKIFPKHEAGIKPPTDYQMELLQKEVMQLFKQDSLNIVKGYYPASVLLPESLRGHIGRLPKLLLDTIRANKQRKNKKSKVFKKDNKYLKESLPAYFKRNFHFQNEGYLSQESASLYEHQVEILFSGTADAMRRALVTSLKKRGGLQTQSPLKILELACGTGSATRFLRAAFPEAHITVTDLSRPYLMKCRERFGQDDNMDFIQADAAHLPFKDQSFDVVCSVFLFHEIPSETRKNIIEESVRLTTSTGIIAHLDSIQKDDVPDLNLFLENFPKQFHEPFFASYSQEPLENLYRNAGFTDFFSDISLLSKVVFAKKT